MNYVYCAHRKYSLNVFKKLKKIYKNFILVNGKDNLTLSKIKKINPQFIFFPDWSWIVPNEIIKNYQCICIHESNLPKFRGGSPLQNQIIRGIKKTKSTAFLMNDKLDAGKILLKKDLSLDGTLDEIFLRMEKNKGIWLSANMLIPIAKLLITPNNVQFYEKFQKTSYNGKLSFIKDYFGIDFGYKNLENLLIGKPIIDIKKGKREHITNPEFYIISPKIKSN